MVSKLKLILKELNDNGNFYISSFSTANGLLLAYHKTTEYINENTLTVMSALLLESANTMREELALSNFKTMIAKYRFHYLLIRSIKMNEQEHFILSALLHFLSQQRWNIIMKNSLNGELMLHMRNYKNCVYFNYSFLYNALKIIP